MRIHRDDDFTVSIGLDWADAKHDFYLQPPGSDVFAFGTFAHPIDAQFALKPMRCYPCRFRPLKPQSVAMRALGFLVEQ